LQEPYTFQRKIHPLPAGLLSFHVQAIRGLTVFIPASLQLTLPVVGSPVLDLITVVSVEDVLSAIEFSRSVSEVSSVDLGLLGWGMGSANVLRAAIAQSEIKAVAVLNGFFDGERWLKRVLSEDRFKEMKQQLAQDQERRQQGETSRTVPAFTYYPLDSNTSQHVSVELSGLHNFGDPVQLGFWESILRLKQDDLVSGLSKTSAAIFVAHGTANKLHPPEESMEFFSALTNNKEHYIIEGAHNDFMYEDNPEFKKLMQAVSSFFQRYF